MIFAISVTLFFLIIRFCVTLFNFLSNPKLPRIAHLYQHHKVSILIPARNEADNMLSLLQSIADQDYQNYEVIVLDDSSTDHTYQVCKEFTEQHPKFKVIKGKDLPNDWLGKNYACYQLANEATGDYLLFLDADEIIYDHLITSAIHRMYLRKLSLLSLFTNQQMVTLGEKAVVPLMHFVLLNLLPLRLVYLLRNPLIAAASGQFMFFEAETYKKHQWHEVVKDKIIEDVEIMKCVKQHRYNGEALLANGMISCRMYKSYTEAINGFSKNFLAAFNYSIAGALIYILFVITGPLIVLMTLNIQLIIFMISLIILTRTMISLSAEQPVITNLLLHPVQMLNMVVVAFLSIQKHLTKTTQWKGRRI